MSLLNDPHSGKILIRLGRLCGGLGPNVPRGVITTAKYFSTLYILQVNELQTLKYELS